jgi:hypothetical protein
MPAKRLVMISPPTVKKQVFSCQMSQLSASRIIKTIDSPMLIGLTNIVFKREI